MKCYLHEQAEAIGTCVGCGKFICKECSTEIQGKNYCKKCVDELFAEKNKELDKMETKQSANQQPMVFMNAGGGGGGGGAAAAAAAASSGGNRKPPYPRNSVLIHIILLCTTAGIGNVVYFLYIKSKQDRWNAM